MEPCGCASARLRAGAGFRLPPPLHALPKGRALKVAIVWNYPSRLIDCSFRFEQYVSGFRALGHTPVIVCTEEAATGFDAPTHLASGRELFVDPGFWRQVGADLAVIVTWHRMSDVLAAIGEAGTRVVAFSDTDGRPGSRLYWRHQFELQIHYQEGLRQRAAFAGRWLGRWMGERLRRSFAEDEEAVRSTRRSDMVAFGHEEGRDSFRKLLDRCGAGDLGDRLAVIPFTVGGGFFSLPVPEVKDDLVVAVGRWSDPQKNAPLLAAVCERLLARRPRTRVEVLGSGGEEVLGPLARRLPTFAYRGERHQVEVAQLLARARSIVFSSRWEGSPHAALEALALGGTIVGPPIPSLRSWAEAGRFGRVSARATAPALARALLVEMDAWDRGQRDPQAISAEWRGRIRPQEVCRRLVERWASSGLPDGS